MTASMVRQGSEELEGGSGRSVVVVEEAVGRGGVVELLLLVPSLLRRTTDCCRRGWKRGPRSDSGVERSRSRSRSRSRKSRSVFSDGIPLEADPMLVLRSRRIGGRSAAEEPSPRERVSLDAVPLARGE